jgi:hypothetical protein
MHGENWKKVATYPRIVNTQIAARWTIFLGLVIALLPQTPKHIRGGWSHYTDISELVHGIGKAQNMVTVLSGFEPVTFGSLAHELTNSAIRAHPDGLPEAVCRRRGLAGLPVTRPNVSSAWL